VKWSRARSCGKDFGQKALSSISQRGQVRLDVRLQDTKTGEILAEMAEIGGSQ
jgi:hypothetical protein